MDEAAGNYVVVRQGVEQLRDLDNAPWVSMPVYLERVGEMERFRRISVYQTRGKTAEEARVLYMNREALAVWRAMGKAAEVVGERKRPPIGSVIAFGVPFSE